MRRRVYKNFVEHIDGIDNGVEESGLSRTDTDVTLVSNYRVTTTLSQRVGKLNPAWNEDKTAEGENECFKKAVKLTGDEFVESVMGYGRGGCRATPHFGRIRRNLQPNRWVSGFCAHSSPSGSGGFVCALKTSFLTRTGDKQCEAICVLALEPPPSTL